MLRAITLILLLFFPPPIFPQNPGPSVTGAANRNITPISYTGNQCGAAGGAGNVTSLTCTITVANTGDTLISFFNGNGNTQNYSSSTITCGTGSIPTDRNQTWSSWRTFLLVVPNATAGSCSYKVSVSGNMTYTTLSVLDFAHANTSTPIDNASCTTSPYCQNSGSSENWSTNSLTTSNLNEMLVSFEASGYSPSSLTENNGFTAVSTSGAIVYYKLIASNGSYSDSWTAGSSGTWGAMITALTH